MNRQAIVSAAVLSAALAAARPSITRAQQSDLTISPFVSFLPATTSNPLAGLALTLGSGSGIGLRASGHIALKDSPSSALDDFGASASLRPWGLDADAVLSLGSRSRGPLAPYVFAGIGVAGEDSLGLRVNRRNWSYGAGTSLALGRSIDLFGEARWRMSRYVLPTAADAPSPTSEMRVGLSFHVGASPQSSSRTAARDRRMDVTPSVMIPSGRVPSTTAARVLDTADDYLGVPYRYGGTSPKTGFDCSGFVQYVFAKQGIQLPRTSRQQAQVGLALSPDWRAVSAGDLVMFEEKGRISHVAIYAGRNRIIHATSSGGGVRFDDLSTERGQWFMDHMVAARRVTASNGVDFARMFAGVVEQLDGPDHAPRPRQ